MNNTEMNVELIENKEKEIKQHRERKSPLFSKYGKLGTIFTTILY